MWWVVSSLVSAATQASRNIVMKDLGDKLDEYVNVLGRFILILPFALVLSIYHGIPAVPSIYWLFSVLAGFFVATATMFLSKAFKHAEISLSVALWKLSTILVLILEVLFLHAHFAPLAVIGICVTVFGVYLLNIEKYHISFIKPLTSLITDKGSRFALLAALFIAPSIIFFKVTINLSDPYFPAFTNYFFAVLFTIPAAFKISPSSFRKARIHWKGFLLMGFLAFLTTVFGNIAYQKSAAMAEAVKQSEILFAIVGGILFFNEKEKVKEIWIGCFVIIVGIILVVLGS